MAKARTNVTARRRARPRQRGTRGDKFAEEARKIHYGEQDPRNIYGETSDEQAEELHEEGVTFSRIPWAPRHNS
jgi:hypothetical protein